MYSRLAFKSFNSVLNPPSKRLDTGSHMHKVVIKCGLRAPSPISMAGKNIVLLVIVWNLSDFEKQESLRRER